MLLTRLVDKHHGGFGLAKWLTFTLEVISSLILMGLMLLTCGDVIGRYLFNNSINGTTELTELALGIIIFCQIPVVTIASAHVVVDILDRLLPSIFLRLSGVISNLIVGAGFYYLAGRIWFMAERSLRRGVFTEFLQIPVAYFIQFISVMMYLSAAVLVIVAVRNLFKKDL
ncbi:TRAP transporter small permease [Marinomonas fungiae]|uniref:TRAP transporter small permease protein n=1 Tax=Marinomonas fungiae TaxID=1137284 RepID=A0A0K6IM21_9GAMM|nr:TRAP transporter small permease [Marinomonas fungiae]CUB04136.1 TRAP-type C4-dicarboxylate transport system, small permease component [Marinomonas fungiae]